MNVWVLVSRKKWIDNKQVFPSCYLEEFRKSRQAFHPRRDGLRNKKITFNLYNSDLSPLSNMIVNVLPAFYVYDLPYDVPFWIANHQNLIKIDMLWWNLLGERKGKKIII